MVIKADLFAIFNKLAFWFASASEASKETSIIDKYHDHLPNNNTSTQCFVQVTSACKKLAVRILQQLRLCSIAYRHFAWFLLAFHFPLQSIFDESLKISLRSLDEMSLGIVWLCRSYWTGWHRSTISYKLWIGLRWETKHCTPRFRTGSMLVGHDHYADRKLLV